MLVDRHVRMCLHARAGTRLASAMDDTLLLQSMMIAHIKYVRVNQNPSNCQVASPGQQTTPSPLPRPCRAALCAPLPGAAAADPHWACVAHNEKHTLTCTDAAAPTRLFACYCHTRSTAPHQQSQGKTQACQATWAARWRTLRRPLLLPAATPRDRAPSGETVLQPLHAALYASSLQPPPVMCLIGLFIMRSIMMCFKRSHYAHVEARMPGQRSQRGVHGQHRITMCITTCV